MLILCPFKNKYKGLIEKAFPSVTIVEGTHFPPEGGEPGSGGKQFTQCAHDMLCAQRPSMAPLARQLYPAEFPDREAV